MIQGGLGLTQHSVAATADGCRGRISYTLDVLYSAAPSRGSPGAASRPGANAETLVVTRSGVMRSANLCEPVGSIWIIDVQKRLTDLQGSG